eukprot:TRINITY_DN17363_c0_g1_i1.p1 TRINITY_DN17363_c0_g1~~TRINITY_DN17363_c0_g1_i1.p1  ORF type:complete len:290 (-),score=23.42 TRINITY_DN17363_c0_g1_i1:33-902(-)
MNCSYTISKFASNQIEGQASKRGLLSEFEVLEGLGRSNLKSKVFVSVHVGVRVRKSSTEKAIEDLHMIISPLAADIRLQSGLVSHTRFFGYTKSRIDIRRPSSRKEDVDVFEFHDHNNRNKLKSYPSDAISVEILNKFLARTIDLLNQRGLQIPILKPNNIIHEGKTSFKLDFGIQESLYSSLTGKDNDSIEILPLPPTQAFIMKNDRWGTKPQRPKDIFYPNLTRSRIGRRRSLLKLCREKIQTPKIEAVLKGLLNHELNSLNDVCKSFLFIIPVSYTHLTLPTIYSV